MSKKSKQMGWWALGVFSLALFILLQIPATWLISKFYKDNQSLQNVSGNIWVGQADWRKGNLQGTIAWHTRPLDLILLRAAANVEIHSGQTQLQGIMGYGFGQNVIIKNMNGQITPETLKNMVNWQWPNNAIQLKDVQFKMNKDKGFSQVEGQLQWAGGELQYLMGQRQDRMNVPSLSGAFKDESSKLILDLQDARGQKMANIVLDQEMMLDVQLTQRLLLNVPSYDGKAGLDTFVISTRQPMIQGASQ